MKFTLPARTFKTALAAATGIVEARFTIPILGNLAVIAGDGEITLRATDLERQCEITIAATVEQSGRTTIPARLLRDIVGRVESGADVVMAQDPRAARCTVKAGNAKFNVPVLDFDDFPDLGFAPEGACQLEIDGEALATGLEQVRFAISTEETRYYLCGVKVERDPEGRGIKLVSTDGHRLAVALVECSVPQTVPNVIIPRKSVAEIVRMAKLGDLVEFMLRPDRVRLVASGHSLVSKTIDGTFPDYTRVIPASSGTRASVTPVDLAAALDRVATVVGPGAPLKLAVSGKAIGVFGSNSSSGSQGSDTVDAKVEGKGLDIGINPRYALDILGACRSDAPVEMSFDDPGSPMRWHQPDGKAIYVLMPMRV